MATNRVAAVAAGTTAADDEAAPATAEGALRLALEAAGMVAWDWDLATDRVACENARVLWDVDGGTADDLLAVVHPEDRARVRAARDAAMARPDQAYLCEYRVLGPDGHQRWLESRGRVVAGAGGGARRIVGISVDVTGRRLAEEAAREGELRYRSLFEGANDAIVLADLETGRYVDWNRRAEELTGYSRDELEAMRLGDMIPRERRADLPQRLHELVQRGSLLSAHEIVAKGGRRIPVELSARVLRLGGRNLMQAILRDLSDRHRAEAALRAGEEQRRLALEAAALGVWDLDLAAGTASLDHRFRELFGFGPDEEVTPEAVWARVHPEDVPRLQAALARAKDPASDGAYEADYRALLPGGRLRWHAARAQAHFAGEGAACRAVRLVGVVMDVTERRTAEQALKESEARLRLAQEVGGIGHWEWDLAAGSVRWSDNLFRILGLDPAETPSPDSFFAMIHPEDRAAARESAERTIRGEASLNTEFRVVLPDGRTRWLASRGEVVHDQAGRPQRLVGVNFDVTERRAAEERLRLHALLLESMAEGVSLSTDDGVIVYTNPAENRMFGYGPGELVGRHVTVQNAYPPEENARVVGEVMERLRAEGAWHGEWRNRRKDGTGFVTSAHITAVEVEGCRHWLCVQADVTEQRAAEAALRESEERLDLAVRAHGIGVFDWHVPSGRVVWSEQEERIFGLEPGAFEGDISGWSARVLPEDLERMQALIGSCMARRETGVDFAFRIRRADTGEVRHIEGSGRFLYAEDGVPLRMVGVNIDVTERQRAGQRQALLLKELSHRVKNTLAVVQGIVGRTLTGGRTVVEARDVLAKRLHALGNAHSLLTASEWRGVALRALAEGELRPYGGRVRIDGPDLLLAPKTTLTLGLVLHELATNAAKHGALSAEKGQVEVGWELLHEGWDGRRLLRLTWRERGGPPVRPPAHAGFGRTLLERGPAHDLGGRARAEFRPEGLVYELEVPIDGATQIYASDC